MPAGDIAEPDAAISIVHGPQDDSLLRGDVGTLALQADPLRARDLGQNAFAAQLAHDDDGVIGRRGKMAKDDIADVGPWIIMAEQESLAFQLRQ